MKRLSVRLSVVGAVLALGAAAIAHSVLSDKEAASEDDSSPKAVADAGRLTPAALAPIRVEREEDDQPSPAADALQPPPSSFFAGNSALRAVSHESVSDDMQPTKSATAIPTADPADMGGGFPLRPPEGTPNTTSEDTLPVAVADTPSGDFPTPPSSSPPPSLSPGAGAAAVIGAASVPTAVGAMDSTPGGLANAPAGSEMGSNDANPTSEQPPPGFSEAGSNNVLASPPPAASMSFPAAASMAGAPPTAVPETDTSSSPPAPKTGAIESPSAASDSLVPAAERSTDPPFATPTTMSGVPSTARSADTASPSGMAPPKPGAAFAAGAVGGAAGAALANGLTNRLDNPGQRSPAGLPASNGYPSTAASVPDAPPPMSTYGTATATPGPSTSPAPSTGHLSGQYNTAAAAQNPIADSALPAGSGLAAGTAPAPLAVPATLAASATAAGGPAVLLASNLPGDRQLEGQQAPAISIEKTAPQEIQVNRQATFQVRVRNNGNAPAHNVVVVDRVPRGTQFVNATPAITPAADGTLIWRINEIRPGGEVVLSMNLLPQMAGEIGSVAQATFQTQASVRTICTKPELKVDVALAQQVLIGQAATLEITVTNVGNGAADKVLIEEDVPEGFTHAAGRELEHEIGTLKPQESRRLTLVIDSKKPGDYQNRLTVRAEGNLFVEDVRPIKITTPQLKISMQGPSRRYLDRKATYSVHLANPGTAAASNVEMVTYLPKGMKYVTSDNQGQYDTQTHAVYWSLEKLPADKQGEVHVTVLPIEPGTQKLKTDIHADLGLKDVCEHEVSVEGLAAVSFVVSDVADPIEVGSETTYEIKVTNRGSKADTDIRLVVELPAGITPTTGSGPTRASVQGQRVDFGPLARLGSQEEAVFKVHARGVATGDHVIRAQIRSAELRVPVTKEEITRVYKDN